jgi:hypothetical protein
MVKHIEKLLLLLSFKTPRLIWFFYIFFAENQYSKGFYNIITPSFEDEFLEYVLALLE